MSFVNVFGGSVVQPADVSYTLITLTANTTLSWPTQFPDPNSLLAQVTTAQIMDVLPSAGGFTLTLPPANQVSVGQSFLFNNLSGTHSFTLLKNNGAVLTAIAAQTIFYFYLTDNTTIGGTWTITPWGLGAGSTVTSVAAVAATAGLTITGSPITTTGTFTFSLSPNLVAVSNISTTGFQVVTAPGTWISRSLVAGTNISIANPDGVAANPTISLNTSLTGITSLTSGNIQISGQTITTTSGNQNLILAANGTGTIQLANNLDANTHSISNVTTFSSTSMQGGNLTLAGNALSATNVNGGIQLNPNGTGSIVLGTNLASSPIVDSAGNFTRLTSLNSGTLTATSSINVGSLVLSANIISSTANASIGIVPNGTGGVSITANLNMNNQNIFNVGNITATNVLCNSINVQGNLIPIPRASVKYDGTLNTIVSSVNIATVTKNGVGDYTFNFSYVFPTSDYIPVITVGGAARFAQWGANTPTSLRVFIQTPPADAFITMVIFY
jgi:hypothetical protein